jgi:hypothetical protein
MLKSFKEILDAMCSYFEGLFWEPSESHIVEQMRVIRLFP